MSGRWERAAVIHRRADGDAGRHLVVDEPAHTGSQSRFDARVQRIVLAILSAVDRSGQIPFECFQDGQHLSFVPCDHEQRAVAERFRLQSMWTQQELIA